ncbi:MAG: BON domain-containing protein [Bacteroidia bacterium]|nr:BON domain-containing protein [Bacteroidia bacterium]
MEIDFEIQRRVINELRTIAAINANEIGVAVKNGIVTLSGTLHSYPAKISIERAVKKLANVKAIAQDIVVNLNGSHPISDSDIANVAINMIEWEDNYKIKNLKILVEDAVVTLEGEVEWDFQRKAATEAIADIRGVKKVINNIKFQNRAESQEIKKQFQLDAEKYRSMNVTSANGKELITSNLDLPNGVISSGNFQSNGHANYNKPAVIKNEGSGDYEDDF